MKCGYIHTPFYLFVTSWSANRGLWSETLQTSSGCRVNLVEISHLHHIERTQICYEILGWIKNATGFAVWHRWFRANKLDCFHIAACRKLRLRCASACGGLVVCWLQAADVGYIREVSVSICELQALDGDPGKSWCGEHSPACQQLPILQHPVEHALPRERIHFQSLLLIWSCQCPCAHAWLLHQLRSQFCPVQVASGTCLFLVDMMPMIICSCKFFQIHGLLPHCNDPKSYQMATCFCCLLHLPGMPRGAKMSLTLHEPIWNVLSSNLHPSSMHAPQTYQTWKVL